MHDAEARVTSTTGDFGRQAVAKVDFTLDCRGLLYASFKDQYGYQGPEGWAKPDMRAWSMGEARENASMHGL